jgi:hypothetical protein
MTINLNHTIVPARGGQASAAAGVIYVIALRAIPVGRAETCPVLPSTYRTASFRPYCYRLRKTFRSTRTASANIFAMSRRPRTSPQSPSMPIRRKCTLDEQRRVLDIARDEVGGRLPIVNGVWADGSLEAGT